MCDFFDPMNHKEEYHLDYKSIDRTEKLTVMSKQNACHELFGLAVVPSLIGLLIAYGKQTAYQSVYIRNKNKQNNKRNLLEIEEICKTLLNMY